MNGESEETFGDDFEKVSNHFGKKTRIVKSCKVGICSVILQEKGVKSKKFLFVKPFQLWIVFL